MQRSVRPAAVDTDCCAVSTFRGGKQGTRMRRLTWQLLVAFVINTLVAGCESAATDGEYVTFVRDLMSESARLKDDAEDGPDRSEQVERAVRVWRGETDE